MIKRVFFTVFILSLPAAILLLGGAEAPSVAAPDRDPLAFPTNTHTPIPCPVEEPWFLYMSDQPHPGQCKEEFVEGISEVYANFYVFDPGNQGVRIQIQVLEERPGQAEIVRFETPIEEYIGTQWISVHVVFGGGGIIPNGEYLTNVINWEYGPGVFKQKQWIVGIAVRFDEGYYYTTSDTAVITVVDPLANQDPTEQETVQIQVTSRSDPTGFPMTLVESGTDSSEFTSVDPGGDLGFSTTDSDPVAGVIWVADGDWVRATYKDVFFDEAIWYEVAATPTSTPPPTIGPSPTSTPTLPPGGTAVTVTPEADAVGYVRSYDPSNERNHFGEADIYVGIWGGFNIHVGAVQFDLSSIPPGVQILRALVELKGKSSIYVGSEGVWKLQLLDSGVDAGWPNHTYANITSAAVLDTIPPELGPGDLGSGWDNIFTFREDQLAHLEERLATTGKASFRLDGPTTGKNNIFIWHTGYGNGDEAKRPLLHIDFNPATPTPTSTATPPPTATSTDTATPTATPTNTATHGVTPTPTTTPTSTPTVTVTPTPMVRAICVLVYEDLNGDGVRDPGEGLLADAVITVTDDQEQEVDGSPYTTDGLSEPYCFTNLTPATYTVREENPPGYVSTTSDTMHVPVLPDIPVPRIEFGDQPLPTPTPTPTPTSTATPTFTPTLTPTPTTGAICVLAFEDPDGDGFRDPGEGLLAGAVITVTDAVGHVVGEPYTTDGVSEPHCFTDLAPGFYTVSAQPPPEYVLTTDAFQGALVFANTAVEVKFGARSASAPTFTPTLTATPTVTPTVTLTPTPTPTPTLAHLYLPLVLRGHAPPGSSPLWHPLRGPDLHGTRGR